MKNRKRAILFSLLHFIVFSCAAQLSPAYTFQKDDTVVKRSYFNQTQEKKKNQLASIGKDYSKDYKKIYEGQFESISDFWQSSSIVTERTAHDYLQSIVQKVIAANSELKTCL